MIRFKYSPLKGNFALPEDLSKDITGTALGSISSPKMDAQFLVRRYVAASENVKKCLGIRWIRGCLLYTSTGHIYPRIEWSKTTNYVQVGAHNKDINKNIHGSST